MQLVKVSKSGGGGGGSGTVTSVGVSIPQPTNPAFSVSNSPIISAGTIAISANGTTSQYIDGTGALQNSVAFTDVGTAIATIPNPSATRYIKINSNNSVSAITASQLLTDLGISSNIILNRSFADTAAVTGTIATTLIFSVLIPANTFQLNDWMTTQLNAKTGTSTTGGADFRIYLNTSPTIGGTTIGQWAAALNTAALFERNFMITAIGSSGSIKYASFAGASPYTPQNVSWTSLTFNTTIDQYLVFAVANVTTTASSTTHGNLITITR